MKYTSLLLIALCLLTQCADRVPNTAQLPDQFFQIDNSRDTTLQAKDGVTIFIPKGAFDHQKINIEFKSATKLEDMVLANLYTMTTFNEPLASHGMFYINAKNESGEQTALKQPIQVTLPNAGQRDDLKVFEGVERKGAIRWQEVGDLDNQAVMDSLAIGKELWDEHCTTCHASNLRTDATGPALGNVTLFRDREWLYEFTMNSQKMIAEGDSLALCLWYDWMSVVMNSFDGSYNYQYNSDSIISQNAFLSRHQVDLIYDFIENESLIQNIDSSEVKYKPKCVIRPNINGILYENDVWEVSLKKDKMYNLYADTLFTLPSDFKDYILSIRGLGWHSITRFCNDSRIGPKNFSINLLDYYPTHTRVNILFPKDNIYIHSRNHDGNSYHFSDNKKDRIAHFPIGETAFIIAVGSDDERLYFAHRKITYGDNEIETLELQEMTTEEVEATIRGLF
jgi:mono/diheme cytochrome c family protein